MARDKCCAGELGDGSRMAKIIMNNKWLLTSILEACEYRMQTTKLNSYITEMAENSISERLIFKIFWGSMPPDPAKGKL